jgi:tRNA 2-thiouridine synthesizing protein A
LAGLHALPAWNDIMTDTPTLPDADLEVDASGLKCPLPILRAKKALAQLQTGQILKVITTDTHAIKDFQAFSKQTGNALEAQVESGEAALHFLRRR